MHAEDTARERYTFMDVVLVLRVYSGERCVFVDTTRAGLCTEAIDMEGPGSPFLTAPFPDPADHLFSPLRSLNHLREIRFASTVWRKLQQPQKQRRPVCQCY